MTGDFTVIKAERLDLVLLAPEVLRASLAGDRAAVEGFLGLTVPDEWYAEKGLIRIRLQQLTRDPGYRPWSIRAMALRAQRQMVGQIGFHTKPGAAYLEPYAPEGVEFGYSVFPPFRRRGYAREACRALMQWAHEQQEVSAFVVTIAPENEPSRRLALQLGFERIGTHVDEADGPEDIFRLDATSS